MEVSGSDRGPVEVSMIILGHSHPVHRVCGGRLPRIGLVGVSGRVSNGIEVGIGGILNG